MIFSWNIRVLLITLIVSIIWRITMGNPRTSVAGQFCNTTLAVSGVVLANNFVPAMDNLSSLVNQNGFGTAVVGQGPNAVFGLAQCMKDLSTIDCKLCFSEIRSLLPKCYPYTGGRIFLDGCYGRYENFSFFNEIMDTQDTKVCSFSKYRSQPEEFGEVVKMSVGNVSSEAQSNQGFAVGYQSGSSVTVYALAQCWENLDKALCNSCLDAAASSILSCSPAIDARSLYAGCYMRYATELFWNVNQTDSNSSGNGETFWIILGSSLGGFLLIIGVVVWMKRGFFNKSNRKSLKDLYGSELSAVISQSNLNFRYKELKKATQNFDTSNKLGQGTFGAVFKAVLPDGREVAVKRLFLNTRQWIDQFFNEVNLINQLRHKNLVKLLGCSVDGPESLLVYEYYYNKSLDLFIFDTSQNNHLDWQKRFDIIQGVAEGLSYLHEETETRIVHRDVKASNILLDEKFKPKITDFGLARSFSEDQTHLSTGIAGTLGYMAPEYVVHGHLTEKADVYSFGILILEILTGKRSSSGVGSQAGKFLLSKIWSHYKSNTSYQLIDESIYDESVKDQILHVFRVGLLCTQATPSSRPTMAKVVELLRSRWDDVELIPSDPPFLDIISVDNREQGESSHLLAPSFGPSLSRSSDSQFTGR